MKEQALKSHLRYQESLIEINEFIKDSQHRLQSYSNFEGGENMLIQRNNKMKALMISSQEGEIKINLMKGKLSNL